MRKIYCAVAIVVFVVSSVTLFNYHYDANSKQVCGEVVDKRFKRIATDYFDVELDNGDVVVLSLKDAPDIKIGMKYCYKK